MSKETQMGPLGRRLLAMVFLCFSLLWCYAAYSEYNNAKTLKSAGIWASAKVENYWKNLTNDKRGVSYYFFTSDRERVDGRRDGVTKRIYRQAKKEKNLSVVYDPRHPQNHAFTVSDTSLTKMMLFMMLSIPFLSYALWLIKTSFRVGA